MTTLMDENLAANRQDMTSVGSSVTRTKAKIRFIEFVRPDGYWPSPYTLEQAFHVYQWFVRTGNQYRVRGDSGPYDLLCKKPSCINHEQVDPIVSIEDLRQRFHYALLSAHTNDRMRSWKEQEKIAIGEERWLSFRHYKPYDAPHPEAEIQAVFTDLLAAKGTLTTQLNRFHPKADDIKCVRLCVWPQSFAFELDYSYAEDWSGWKHELARSNDDEPFHDVLFRAIETIDKLKAGAIA